MGLPPAGPGIVAYFNEHHRPGCLTTPGLLYRHAANLYGLGRLDRATLEAKWCRRCAVQWATDGDEPCWVCGGPGITVREPSDMM